jgi:hypothetical protein
MESVLNKLQLGNLVDKFKAERIEIQTVLSATDEELVRLGVVALGDRVRLREICRKTENSSSLQLQGSQSSSTSSSQSLAAPVIQERSHLFSVNRSLSRPSRASSSHRGGRG